MSVDETQHFFNDCVYNSILVGEQYNIISSGKMLTDFQGFVIQEMSFFFLLLSVGNLTLLELYDDEQLFFWLRFPGEKIPERNLVSCAVEIRLELHWD